MGEGFLEWNGSTDVEALGVVDTAGRQVLERVGVFDVLGDGGLAEALGEGDDSVDDEAVGEIVDAVQNELAVDLEIAEWQIFEVVEAAEARAEVVERERAPEVESRSANSRAVLRLATAAVSVTSKVSWDGSTPGDSARRCSMNSRKSGVSHRDSGQVHLEGQPVVDMGGQGTDRVIDHPAVDAVDQSELLGNAEERRRTDDLVRPRRSS